MARTKILATRTRIPAAALLIAATLAALLWLAGRESVARWAAARVVAASNARLAVTGVQGSLYGPLHIASLSWDTPERRIELQGLELDWSPLRLLFQQEVRVNKATLQSLRLEIKKSGPEPMQLPGTLRLPVGVEIPHLSIARIEVQRQESRYPFQNLAATLSHDEVGYRFTLLRGTTPWGDAEAGLKLGARRPFALDGHVALQQPQGSRPFAARLDLKGTLEKVMATASARRGRMEAKIESVLLPFAAMPLQQASIRGQHLDPAQLGSELPSADIGFGASLLGGAADHFQGTLQVENQLPGAADQARLPLKKLDADFSGTPDKLAFKKLRLDLGAAGQFAGAAKLLGRHLNLDLVTHNLNLHGLLSSLKPTALAGDIRIDAEEETQNIFADLKQSHYQITLEAQHAAGRVQLKKAGIRANASELQLKGEMSLTENKPFKSEGTLKHFNPADFGQYPAAALNGSFAANGHLSPQWLAAVDFSLSDSRYRGHPLAARGAFHATADRVWDGSLDARLAKNRLFARGAFGQAGDRLEWRIDAGDLAVIGPEFGGRIQATGTLEGTLAQPSGSFQLAGRQLRWTAQHEVQRVSASGRLDQGLDGELALDAEISAYRSGSFSLEQAGASGRGRRSKHVLELRARNTDLDLHAELAGGWHDQKGWSGELRQFSNKGREPLTLRAPAQLAVGPQQLLLQNAALDFADGEVAIHELSRMGSRISSRGEFNNLSLARLQKHLGQSLDLETTLRLGGQWSVAADNEVNGTLAFSRESGDIVMLTEPKIRLGLTRLAFKLDAAGSRVTGTLDAAGTTLGSVSANASTRLSRMDGNWGLAGASALEMAADASLPSLAWLSPLLDRNHGILIDGNVQARLRADGTLQNPGWSGFIAANALKVDVPDQGIYFKDGRLRAELDQNTLALTQLFMRGGSGQLSGQGKLSVADGVPATQLRLVAEKLEVLARPDRHLVLSGAADANTLGRQVALTAKLKADRGLIELPKADKPTLSDDVIVLGHENQKERKPPPYRTKMDLSLDLGEAFYFKGRGLDTQLSGALRIRAADGEPPQAVGSIHAVKGDYSAYGQRLVIDRGILNFAGPLDNPGLNIVAMRKNQPVEAGVALSGTALQPRIRLVSNPSVPDNEKLSWLVLGHGMESASGNQFAILQAAAGALLAAGESVTLQSRIAHAAGLDQFGLSGAGGLESTVLTLGKRLSSRAYLSYEQGLLGATSLVKINYALTKRLSVRSQTGTDNAVDLFYTFSFN